MNKIIILGRLTKDPEGKQYANGSLVKFTIAEDKKFKQEGRADTNFFSCIAFGKNADFIAKYFHKGKFIHVIGRVDMDQYEKNGQKIPSFGVIVEECNFCGDSGNSTKGQNTAAQAATNIPDGFADEMPFF